MTVVEEIEESDAEALVELFKNAGPFVSARSQSDYWLYARLFSNTCLCIRDNDGRPIAALISFVDQTSDNSEIYLQDIAVSPQHRGKRYGHLLMNAIYDHASASDVERIWLTSEPENVAALRLWSTLGYSNLRADYLEGEIWITRDLKGVGRDRAIFELHVPNKKSGDA